MEKKYWIIFLGIALNSYSMVEEKGKEPIAQQESTTANEQPEVLEKKLTFEQFKIELTREMLEGKGWTASSSPRISLESAPTEQPFLSPTNSVHELPSQSSWTTSKKNNQRKISSITSSIPLPFKTRAKNVVIPRLVERFFHRHFCSECRNNPQSNVASFQVAVLACEEQTILEYIDRKGVDVNSNLFFDNPWHFDYTKTPMNLSIEQQHPFFKGTALSWLVLKGRVNTVKKLMKRGANPNLLSEIRYPSYKSIKQFAHQPTLQKEASTSLNLSLVENTPTPREEGEKIPIASSSSSSKQRNPITSYDIVYYSMTFTALGALRWVPATKEIKLENSEPLQFHFKSDQCEKNEEALEAILKQYKNLQQNQDIIFQHIVLKHLRT